MHHFLLLLCFILSNDSSSSGAFIEILDTKSKGNEPHFKLCKDSYLVRVKPLALFFSWNFLCRSWEAVQRKTSRLLQHYTNARGCSWLFCWRCQLWCSFVSLGTACKPHAVAVLGQKGQYFNNAWKAELIQCDWDASDGQVYVHFTAIHVGDTLKGSVVLQ